MQAPASVAAWKNVPAWYVVAENDRALSPELQREMARNIGATTVSVSSSHAVMLSAPERIAQVILSALSTAVD